jgi:hypothetical protein
MGLWKQRLTAKMISRRRLKLSELRPGHVIPPLPKIPSKIFKLQLSHLKASFPTLHPEAAHYCKSPLLLILQFLTFGLSFLSSLHRYPNYAHSQQALHLLLSQLLHAPHQIHSIRSHSYDTTQKTRRRCRQRRK